jgi:hypothetical protein
MAALYNPGNPTHSYFLKNLRTQAEASNMKLLPTELKTPDALDDVFTELAAQRPSTLQIMSDSGIFDLSDRIAALAQMHRHSGLRNIPRIRRGWWSTRLWRIETPSLHPVWLLHQKDSSGGATR